MATTARDERGKAIEDFRESIRGTVIEPDDDGYNKARTVWNAMIDRHPAVIVQCTGAADVIAAVNFAREQDLPLAVKAGGHNVAGNGVCDDGLTIDLSPMKSIRVDPDKQIVQAQPGVTLGELDRETQAFGLVVPAGVISTTGVAGLTLGGGWGWLSRTYGLTIDNLRRVDLVTAEGELVHASETEHPDLFWAIRGGGGNFGVVTSLEYDAHEVGPEILGGMIVHPFDDATELLRAHRDFVAEASDELVCYAAILTAPPEPFLPREVHGTTVVAFVVCYSGDVEAGEAAIKPLREVGEPIADIVGPVPFLAQQSMLDEAYAPGLRNYWKTQLVDPLPDKAIDVVVERCQDLKSPYTQIVLEHLGGAIARVNPDATAFQHRTASFSFNIFPRWEDPGEDAEHIMWARNFHETIVPYATEGVAPNFISDEGDEHVRAAYGDNYERLQEVKAEYDPDNVFHVNQNIEPAN